MFVIMPYLVEKKDAANSKTRSFLAFPYGVLSIASYIKANSKKALDINIFDCNFFNEDELLGELSKSVSLYDPDIVGISMMFDASYKYLNCITNTIKSVKDNVLLVLGGASSSASYDSIINEQNSIDAICYSEGEKPFLNLVNADDMLEQIEKDVSWITKKSINAGRIPKATFIQNLDEVIDVDYSLVNIEKYKMDEAFSPFNDNDVCGKKQFFVVTSRGCPFDCVFCSEPARHGKKIRYASIDKIMSYLDYLVSDYGLNVLTIYDDQLLLDKKRAKELFRRIANYNIRVECPNGLSVAYIDEEMAFLMKKAGIDTAALAIESGSGYVLKEIIHKPLKLSMVKPVVQMLRKNDIFVEGFFVMGLPGETDAHREETLDFIKEVELDWSGFSMAAPVRGSRLYDICISNGYIPRNLSIGDIDLNKYMINAPGNDVAETPKKVYVMNLDVNFVNNYRMKTGQYEIAARCFKDVAKRYENHAFAYYYLSKAYEYMGKSMDLANHNMDMFNEIVSKDKTWREYAKYFSLI